jgi:ATP-dependent DNA helicase RecQ
VVVAHNGHDHDLAHLSRLWGPEHPVVRRPLVDTLLWSPLAFPANPYHRLVKDREIVREDGNDPVADARACRRLLLDVLDWRDEAIHRGDPRLALYRRGLSDHVGRAPWRGGAEWLLSEVEDRSASEALAEVQPFLDGRGCARATPPDVDAATWAYVAAWLGTPLGSVVPAWVRHRFPDVRRVLAALRDVDCGRCPWCIEQHRPETHLRRWFGLDAFRPSPPAPDGTSLQRAITAAGLQDRSLFAVLPTGGGKSIGFQVPAFARFSRRGLLTVVVSPLQSLMKDQVDQLSERTGTHHAAALSGALTLVERQQTLEAVRRGDVGLVYVSPEQLRNPGVRKALRSREIGAWVFDEAHCIAEWGHDFRPDFWYAPRFIAELAQEQGVPVPPVAAFTATAQPEVVAQIRRRLRDALGVELELFDGGAERANLTYRVETCDRRTRRGRAIELLDPMRGRAGAVVVFCPTKKECETVSAELVRRGWAAAPYHAGLDGRLRRETQDRFLAGDLRAIAATSAFGMGVDKADVRLVVHLEMPDSIESYLQQAGRAGRDGAPAECVLLHDGGDLERHLVAADRSRLRQNEIQQILRVVRRFTQRGRSTLTAGEILRLVGTGLDDERDGETRIVTGLSWIERAGLLRRDENHPRVFQGRPQLRSLEEARGILAKGGLSEADVEASLRILREMLRPPDGGWSADDLASLAGLVAPDGAGAFNAGLRAIELLEGMARRGVLSEGVQLSAVVARSASDRPETRLARIASLQRTILEQLRVEYPDPVVGGEDGDCELDVVALTRHLRGEQPDALPEVVRRLVRAVADDRGRDGTRSMELTAHGHRRFLVRFGAGWDVIRDRAESRVHAAAIALRVLSDAPRAATGTAVEFALADVTDALEQDLVRPSPPSTSIRDAERALLFLHELRVIELQNGLAVFRVAMHLTQVPGQEKRRYNQDDYAPLLAHYQARRVQMQAMHTYAARAATRSDDGRQIVRDWFTLSRREFERRWLKERLDADREARILGPLDADQRGVVRQPPDRNLAVVAGPGSGKTRTVIHRVAWLVHHHDARPEGMLVLCYNRSTAADIRKRLREMLGAAAAAVTVLTLHALALRLTGADLGGRGDEGFAGILKEATDLLRATRDRPGLPADETRERLLGRWTHVFVDEVQDVDDDQAALIDALIDRSRRDDDHALTVFAVGDDDQAIYGWRGARSRFLREFPSRYAAERLDLVQNYRSTRAILDVAQQIVAPLTDRLKHAPGRVDDQRLNHALGGRLESDRRRGRVCVVDAADEASAAGFILDEIVRLRRDHAALEPFDGFAVLGRHRQPLWRLREVLRCGDVEARVPMPDAPPLLAIREVAVLLDRARADHEPFDAVRLRDLLPRGRHREDPWAAWLAAAIHELADEIGNHRLTGRDVAEYLAERAADERRAAHVGTGVHLGTQHGAKGLEWRVVFALGDVSPADVAQDPGEERRLAYVTATRAREALYLVRWPGGRPVWGEVGGDAVVREVAATPHPAWRDVTRHIVGLGDVWIDFAGRKPETDRVHRALAGLSFGDPVTARSVQPDGSFLWRTDAGVDVAWVSASADVARRIRDGDRGKVVAVVRRTAEQVADPKFRDRLRVSTWWVPVVSVALPPGR